MPGCYQPSWNSDKTAEEGVSQDTLSFFEYITKNIIMTDMKGTIICRPWNPKETWQFIKAAAKLIWEYLKFEWTVIH